MLSFFGVFSAGCAASAPTFDLVLRASADANGARSVQVVARAIDAKAFGAEPYEAVAARVMAPDESVRASVAILPGQAKELKLREPEKGALAIYALLEHPDADAWRLLLLPPIPKKLVVRIERSRICRVQKAGQRCLPSLPRR